MLKRKLYVVSGLIKKEDEVIKSKRLVTARTKREAKKIAKIEVLNITGLLLVVNEPVIALEG